MSLGDIDPRRAFILAMGAIGKMANPELDNHRGVPETFGHALRGQYQELFDIMMKKRQMRGPENITRQGLSGVVSRIANDKMARVERHVRTEAILKDLRALCPQEVLQPIEDWIAQSDRGQEDSLIDDLRDIANYAVIAVMLIQEEWELPL